MTDLFLFEVLGQNFGIHCSDAELRAILRANWGHLVSPQAIPDFVFQVTRTSAQTITLALPEGQTLTSPDTCVFLYQLEQEVIIQLQKRRPDLFFLHAAAAERDGKACLLIAASGSGKSTTEWAMLHHGFGYLSDELAPIDLDSITVYAYPHALCVKQPPPLPYRLPSERLQTRHSLHVPVRCLPRVAGPGPYPISAALFLTYRPAASAPTIRAISAGEASARLYANALNPLAHPNAGLNAAVQIARRVPGFLLETADLTATCELIQTTLNSTGEGNMIVVGTPRAWIRGRSATRYPMCCRD